MATKKEFKEHSVDFMLAEFSYLTEIRENSMERREDRYKSLLNLITGAIGLIALVFNINGTNDSFYMFLKVIVGVLYLYGLIAFPRLVDDTIKVRRFTRAINRVRRYFADMDKDLIKYISLPVYDDVPPITNRWALAKGLEALSALTNTLLISFISFITFFETLKYDLVISTILSIFIGLLNWSGHIFYYSIKSKKSEKETDIRFPSQKR